jgi:hypothetical protein
MGRRDVADRRGSPVASLGPRPAKERSHDLVFVKHHLLTVQAVINLRLAAEAIGGSLPYWLDERELRAQHRADRTELPVIPDAFLVLAVDGGVQSFCLEADRATIALRGWRLRFQAYWAWMQQPSYRERFHRPAVLTVVDAPDSEAERRVASLKALAEEEARANHADPSLFWFTTLRQARQAAVLSEPVWLLAGSEVPRRLLP